MPAPVNKLKQALADGKQTIGCWLVLGDSYAAEIAASAGFDWCVIDNEHAPNDLRSTLAQLQALSQTSNQTSNQTPNQTPVSAVVRPPIGETHILKQFLDIGCQSFVVPMVESAAQAAELVRATRYPPDGVRGVGASTARASNFNAHADYLHTANDQICLFVQVESRAGLAVLPDILAVDGVDGVFIGPSDLSADLGHLGNPHAPPVVTAIDGALDAIAASGKASGIFAVDPVDAERYLARGVSFVAVASDINSMTTALRQTASRFRQ